MKLQDMREKTIDELKEAVVDFKKQLFDLRLKKTMNKLEDPSLIAKTIPPLAVPSNLVNTIPVILVISLKLLAMITTTLKMVITLKN